jgi:hypothetical protein
MASVVNQFVARVQRVVASIIESLRFRITTHVPILRINNVTPQDMLPGVRQVVQTNIEQHYDPELGGSLPNALPRTVEDSMKRQYLHLCAYSCNKCRGPVVSASLGVRENEISKESPMRQVGAICLECGHRQNQATERLRSILAAHGMGASGCDQRGRCKERFRGGAPSGAKLH